MKTVGVYIHVPFCRAKCGYCDFYSFRGTEEEKGQYLEAVMAHLRRSLPGRPVGSIYIGGGTPSLLGEAALCRILDTVTTTAEVLPHAEITVETNPAAEGADLSALAAAGVNRISLGVQSAHARELRALGRRHTNDDILRTVQAITDAGIDNYNLDLMYGIPYQTESTWDQSIDFVLSLSPAHVSAYALKLEEGTPLYHAVSAGNLSLPEEDLTADLYEQLVRRLAGAGIFQYEISNFARPGKESRHNLNYWHCGEYLAFGPAAAGYVDSTRYTYCRDLSRYIDACRAGRPDDAACEIEVLDDGAKEQEFVMLSLRLSAGVSLSEYRKRFGADFNEVYGKACKPYFSSGHMIRREDAVAFSTKGFLVSNYILSDILKF